jgi:hypothetical protein
MCLVKNQGRTMMDMVQGSLAAGDYVAAIQDELGNMGATATMNITGAQRDVVTSGSVGVAPSLVSPSSYASQPAAIISLSPAAQNILSGAQIALDMITATRQSEREVRASATEQNNNATEKPGTTDGAPTLIQPSTGDVISSRSDPSIADIVKQAQSALSDPAAVFYNMVNQDDGPASFISYVGDAQMQQSFVTAFNNKTLTIQNASDVAGLDYQDKTVLTGTSENAGGGINGAWMAEQDKTNGTYSSGMIIPVIGGIYVTWANPSANTGSGASMTDGAGA